ncbi:uncharacterized protein DFL_001221 [Arthrobotrys flagrans]|uniref:Major facilitator superfamily (MFS) profile domain-containing protein n=1 Tax=Arthrobotrys flagrans TaxID=97331 RepID=A0A437AGH5_ARTFL|nr:hypothetical protein DFL_001221 [Arthrobotrys flagrans]
MASEKPPASQTSNSTLTDTTNLSANLADEKLDKVDVKPQQKQSKAKTILVFISVFLSMFLVALDRTIISTAIPQITDEFNSITDVGWYGSAYLLTCCAFQLLLGKVYTLYSVKAVLLGNILLFEVGSALCGAAPNSGSFIFGRAISGIGAAGIFAGTVVCIVHTVPLHKRPQLQGLFGALFGLASIVGPIVGGAFTSHVSWRWCFYINLPLGGVSLIVIFFWLHIPEQDTMKHSWAEKLLQLDAIVYFLPLWFQTIKGVSAVDSGIRILPFMLSMVVGSIIGGAVTPRIGYYTPFAIVGSCIMSVGGGLLTTLQTNSGPGQWIGYQVVYGLGMGLCFQVPNLAAQTGIDKTLITEGGATTLLNGLDEGLRETVLVAYNEALRRVFQVGLVVTCLAVIGAATLEWRSILKPQEGTSVDSQKKLEDPDQKA